MSRKITRSADQHRADKRAVIAELSKAENQGHGGFIICSQKNPARVHVIISTGEGPNKNWMSQSMEPAEFEKLIDRIMPFLRLPESKGGD